MAVTAVVPTTVLVTGANGFIGGRFASAALTRGLSVRTLTRSQWDGEPAVPVADRFLGALPSGVPEGCLQGVDAVVHCAAQTGRGTDAEAWAVNVEGTLRLARAAGRAGVPRFVFLSSQSARPDAASAYGRTKHEAERLLLALDDIEVFVVRPGLVCGPGARGLFRRLSDLVEMAPVLPLLGGGTAPVQPIHVDDLCEAIFRIVAGSVQAPAVLQLGDPRDVPLADFLQAVSVARLGRRRLLIPLPLAPVEAVAGLAESLRIPFPVTRSNLRGLRTVERMETAPDLAQLGLTLRPLAEAVATANDTRPSGGISLDRRPVGVVLVGGGRIGLVHAITASRQRGMRLAAVVDTSPASLALVRGMGVRTRFTSSLAEALALPDVDAAIVATPVTSHLPLARRCLSAGLRVFVEKPLAIREDQIADFEALAREFPDRPIQVGYLAPRYPQARAAIDRLRGGAWGQVHGFLGLTLLSLIEERDSRRWEVQPAISGGGVLINAGGHILSLVHDAFGEPEGATATTARIVSSEVEDSMCAEIAYPGIRGRLCASWSIDGFPRQENRLVVWTDAGVLTVTNNTAVLERTDGEVEVSHQIDSDVGFNLAPDYAGGVIATEHGDLQASVRTGVRAPMDLGAAAAVERLLFRLYRNARDGGFASDAASAPAAAPRPGAALGGPPVPAPALDIRDVRPDDAVAFLRGPGACRWPAFLVTPSQAGRLGPAWTTSDRLRVTVPDFMRQARLLATNRSGRLLVESGLRGAIAGALAAFPAVARARGVTFWAAARGLLAADLAWIPRRFGGTLLVHGYLVDLALAVGRPEEVEALIVLCRRRAPRARVGVHTNLIGETAVLVASGLPVDDIHFLSSPGALGVEDTVATLTAAVPSLRLVAEVGPAPAAVHRLAARVPARWAHGVAGVVVGAPADPDLAALRRERVALAWETVFPGVPLPEEVL